VRQRAGTLSHLYLAEMSARSQNILAFPGISPYNICVN